MEEKNQRGGITGGKNTGATQKGWHDIKNWLQMPEPVTEDAKKFQGAYGGFQPKPAAEVVIVAMKPMDEKTFVAQVLKNGKGVTWLDSVKIPCEKRFANWMPDKSVHAFNRDDNWQPKKGETESDGRFPANLLCSDDVLNDGQESKSISGGISSGRNFGQESDDTSVKNLARTGHDSGSFSRYFDLDAWFAKRFEFMPEQVRRTLPFMIVPKPSAAEKNKGCESLPLKQTTGGGGLNNTKDDVCGKFGSIKAQSRNPHPTVKPIQLMSYLIELGSRKGDMIVDPFAGSGTTGIAAVLLERNVICMELSEENAKICKARISKWAEYIQKTLF